MPYLKKASILFDLTHNELVNPDDHDYSEFSQVLKRYSVNIKKTESELLSLKLLEKSDILVLGCPVDDYFSRPEIKSIIDYIRNGGNCLLITEYGGDFLQKTNLNDIVGKYFSIYFRKDIVKEENPENENCNSILSIRQFENHPITNQLREVVIGGTCSLSIGRGVTPLLYTTRDSWSEVLDGSMKFFREDENYPRIIAACTEYGKGKVVAIGDVDIFTNDFIERLDNKKFILNILNWLTEPVKESNVMKFILNQLGSAQSEIRVLNNKINNIIETITLMAERITTLEENLERKIESIKYRQEIKEKKLEKNTTTYI
ncbi:MAG: DUF4350 domain-containing protein [Promethearchaeia archaeon]